MELTHIDPLDLLTATEAAEMCGVKPVTIRQWVFKGLLTAVDLGEYDRGRKLYRLQDVARAEKATRAKAKRVLVPAA
ncbi:helix-turn-helix domain-containing protein [Streptomyces coeruleorubidus]|uniref:helix-turn-helix domain-containing protein n=1 Tax=Streptomyces coeruleorubidus TaxID=116188 RepID=UPI0033DA4650